MPIEFPKDFPTEENMFEILHKTFEKSWKTDLSGSDIEEWLQNFTGEVYTIEEERKLALWLLCNYTYYSASDVNHLCRVLYNKFIHDFVIRNSLDVDQLESQLKNVVFSSVGSASESGGLLLYHFRQEANLTLDKFFYPTNIESDKNTTLVFVDDAMLSGGTGTRNYFDALKNKEYKNAYYLTIIASEEAINKLQEKGIIVIYCAIVDSRNKCFSEDSMIFNRFPDLLEYSKNMAKNYGEKILSPNSKAGPLGYKDGEFCFGFYYNTPNNTLPIFWSNYNWRPIFARKEKLQNARQLHFNPRKYI